MFNSLKQLKDHQLLLLMWLMLLGLVCLNCTAHELFIEKVPFSLSDSVLWSLQEYGVWLGIIPALTLALNTRRALHNLKYLSLIGVYTLTVVLTINTLIDTQFLNTSWQESLINNWHKHLIAYISIVGILWTKHHFINNARRSEIKAPIPSVIEDENAETNNSNSPVIVINDTEFFLRDILFIKAAGNYIEVMTHDGLKLVRSTLKEMKLAADSSSLIQCHRSYLVNIEHIIKLENARAGHGLLTLISNHEIPVSKSKRSMVKSLIRL